jgi:hypothetical protein
VTLNTGWFGLPVRPRSLRNWLCTTTLSQNANEQSSLSQVPDYPDNRSPSSFAYALTILTNPASQTALANLQKDA